MNLDYYNIKDKYFTDEIVIYTNFYKIPEHPLRKNIKEIKIYDDIGKIYEFDLIDNLVFVSNDYNKKLYIKIFSSVI